MSLLLLAAVAAPAVAALAVLLAGPARGEAAGRRATAGAGIAFALAVAVLVAVVAEGPVSAVLERADGSAVLGLHADRVGAVVLVLVCAVAFVVQAFARRYLRGDARATRFFLAASALTAATAAMVCAATLVGLAVAWTAAGAALCLALATYRGLPAADEGVRRTARAFAIGDGALWLAVALALATWGDLDLRLLGERAPELAQDGAVLVPFACLLVVAAAARSAQLPLQAWLPATLAAPTPVSALLHAGVVNAGGVLLVRLSPLFGASAAATHLAFALGAATAVYGTAVMLTKADVKGGLAHSTMGQMGFMVMTVGLGAFAAAIFHLVAHGMYKATLFLGSGGAVHRHVRHRKAPPVAPVPPSARRATALVAVLLPAAAVAGAGALLYRDVGGTGGSGALLVFAWATAAGATWTWLQRHRTLAGVVVAAGATCAFALAYVATLAAFAGFLAPALAGAGTGGASPWLLVPVLLVLMGLTAARSAADGGPHRVLYVALLGAGQVRPRSRRRRAGPRRAPVPAAALATGGAGGSRA